MDSDNKRCSMLWKLDNCYFRCTLQAGHSGCCVIKMPPGPYRIGSLWTIPRNLIIEGANAPSTIIDFSEEEML